jgi:Bacterial regulatory proteins, lacI family
VIDSVSSVNLSTDAQLSKEPTIHDIAQLARVSVGTVSNVLNGRQTVGEDLALRVNVAANKLGYRRNLNAASLRSNQTLRCRILRTLFLLKLFRCLSFWRRRSSGGAISYDGRGRRTRASADLQPHFPSDRRPNSCSLLRLSAGPARASNLRCSRRSARSRRGEESASNRRRRQP